VEPKKHNPQISDRTNRAILTGMKLDPKQRPQSMWEWLDSLGLTVENSQPSVIVPSNTNSNWERNIQFWGVVIAAIGVFIALLAAIPSWIPIFHPSPSSNQPSQSPNPSSSKTP
jgi:hypothetical protein